MEQNSKIGIFDSGFGGLTIFKCIQQLLPEYDYLYLGDNARTPYGNRSFERVLEFTQEGVEFLFQQGCRLIIIACNTSSARALRSIQQQTLTTRYRQYPFLRVLGVIRPTVENLSSLTQTKQAALWATTGTVNSGSFPIEIAHFAPEVRMTQIACPLLVPLIESGELTGEGVDYFIKKYWHATLLAAKSANATIDTLLLGCTHYPLLLPSIRKIILPEVNILTQGELVCRSLQDYLQRHPEMEGHLSKGKSTKFFTSDQCDFFDHFAKLVMGERVTSSLASLS